jgi:Tfp pilus assembly protein PilN
VKPVNLMPEAMRPRSSAGAVSGYWAVAILGALVLAVLVYVQTANQVTERQAEQAELQHETAKAEARGQALAAFGNFTQAKATRLASVTQLAQGRFDWERFVRELAHVMPPGTWLTEASASSGGDEEAAPTGGTSSESSGDATLAGLPTAELIGCAPGQDDVATLMVRLRRLYRAQDVTLTDSSDSSATGGSAGGDCGNRYAFEIAISFAAVPPQPVASRVPVSLGGGQ